MLLAPTEQSPLSVPNLPGTVPKPYWKKQVSGRGFELLMRLAMQHPQARASSQRIKSGARVGVSQVIE